MEAPRRLEIAEVDEEPHADEEFVDMPELLEDSDDEHEFAEDLGGDLFFLELAVEEAASSSDDGDDSDDDSTSLLKPEGRHDGLPQLNTHTQIRSIPQTIQPLHQTRPAGFAGPRVHSLARLFGIYYILLIPSLTVPRVGGGASPPFCRFAWGG